MYVIRYVIINDIIITIDILGEDWTCKDLYMRLIYVDYVFWVA